MGHTKSKTWFGTTRTRDDDDEEHDDDDSGHHWKPPSQQRLAVAINCPCRCMTRRSDIHICNQSVACLLLSSSRHNPSAFAVLCGDISKPCPANEPTCPSKRAGETSRSGDTNMLEHLHESGIVFFNSPSSGWMWQGGERGGVGASRWHMWAMFASSSSLLG